MGAYIVMFPKAKIITLIPVLFLPLFVESSAFVYIGFWFILQLFSGTLSFRSHEAAGGIAWWAHIGGFITGIVLLPLFRRKHLYRRGYPDETYHYINS
jgi:membrane associated rhomboid family serine protease